MPASFPPTAAAGMGPSSAPARNATGAVTGAKSQGAAGLSGQYVLPSCPLWYAEWSYLASRQAQLFMAAYVRAENATVSFTGGLSRVEWQTAASSASVSLPTSFSTCKSGRLRLKAGR